MMASAKTSEGIASMRLVRPLTRSSHQPPQYPAVRPSVTPIRLLQIWLTMPTVSEMRAPWTIACASFPSATFPSGTTTRQPIPAAAQ